MHTRRAFLQSATAAAALPQFLSPALRAQTPASHIDVLVNEPVGTIAPEIYSHFVEHLGGVVYDGIWVGEDSKIANVHGIRKALVDALAKIKPGVIRWPGGCYADGYDWRDGIGPRSKRPKRTNFWADTAEWPKNANRQGPQSYEPNLFGTMEFAHFCKLTGAKPYFASNLRSLPAQEFWRWVEYCNSPAGSTTLAEQRAADGSKEPLGIQFWGVGNESWGCGGNFIPDDYATEFRRYTAWVPSYGTELKFIGAGPNQGDTDWTRRFFAKVAQGGVLNRMWGWAMHHYAWNASAGRTNDWAQGKRDALQFDTEQYYEILHQANQMDGLIRKHWQVMEESDPKHRVKLVVDEWGAWYAPGTEPFAEALIGQQNTIRDAVLAGLTLDTFHRHAEKVAMANIAQLVNCLQSLFLAHEDRFCVTPTYHVFAMYAAHQGAQSVRTIVGSPEVSYARNGATGSIPGLNGSASIKGKQLTLTVTNPSLDQTIESDITLRGATAQSVQVEVLAGDAHAHNTLTSPDQVKPAAGSASVKGGAVQCKFVPSSVTKLTVMLA